jgi:hypothetical protein
MLLPIAGFFSGAISLLGATKARRQDISAAFAGMAMNSLLLFGIWYTCIGQSHDCSPRAACIANLKQIDGAKAVWALEKQKGTNDVPADSDLFGKDNFIREKPVCPQDGTYKLGSVSEKPTCSIPGHSLP